MNTDSEQEDKTMQSQPSITIQNTIYWGNFIRGRISQLFHSQIKHYYKQNRLGKRFRSQFWCNRLITFTLTLNADEWRHHCAEIHRPTKEKNKPYRKHHYLNWPTNTSNSHTSSQKANKHGLANKYYP